MKYQQEQVVSYAGKQAKIVATKEKPWNTKNDYLMRKERFPEEGKDYLILLFKERNYEKSLDHYVGEVNVYEHELENLE